MRDRWMGGWMSGWMGGWMGDGGMEEEKGEG